MWFEIFIYVPGRKLVDIGPKHNNMHPCYLLDSYNLRRKQYEVAQLWARYTMIQLPWVLFLRAHTNSHNEH